MHRCIKSNMQHTRRCTYVLCGGKRVDILWFILWRVFGNLADGRKSCNVSLSKKIFKKPKKLKRNWQIQWNCQSNNIYSLCLANLTTLQHVIHRFWMSYGPYPTFSYLFIHSMSNGLSELHSGWWTFPTEIFFYFFWEEFFFFNLPLHCRTNSFFFKFFFLFVAFLYFSVLFFFLLQNYFFLSFKFFFLFLLDLFFIFFGIFSSSLFPYFSNSFFPSTCFFHMFFPLLKPWLSISACFSVMSKAWQQANNSLQQLDE